MGIKWKSRKGLNPDLILKRLDECKTIKDGQVSFSGFEKLENEIAIASMLEFDSDVSAYEKSVLVNKALFTCAKRGINRENFKKTINQALKISRSGRRREFRLLTTVSIKRPFILPDIEIDGCKIQFSHSPFPKEYSSRRKLLKDTQNTVVDDEKHYTKVTVTTLANKPQLAGEKCLNALNLIRGFLCLQCNNLLTMSFGATEYKPINKIILGKFHTLHEKNGELATQLYWYIPNYIQIKPFTVESKNEETLKMNISWIIEQLQKLNPKDLKRLKGAILRFVNAFDHTDHHSTLIVGWGSLESLVSGEKEGNNDLISKRCSNVFTDREFHKQILEHIREYRNQNVHYGESSEDPATICYQLQRYFKHLVLFYLTFADDFKNLSEANSFLDLPNSIPELKRKSELIKRAIKYHSPKEGAVTSRSDQSSRTTN